MPITWQDSELLLSQLRFRKIRPCEHFEDIVNHLLFFILVIKNLRWVFYSHGYQLVDPIFPKYN